MSRRPAKKLPSYRLHRSSGQAITTMVDAVTGQRRDRLLGKFDTPESRSKWATLISKWEAAGRRLDVVEDHAAAPVGSITVNALTNAYLRHIEPLISPTHYMSIERALGLLATEYGDTSAATLGPRKVKQVRITMVGLGWKRETVNKGVRFIVAAFRWAASEELVKADVHTSLATIPNLKLGEMGVEDGDAVPPAPESHVDAACDHLPRQIVAMIRLQILTGMRPGEVVTMRRCDIDTTGKVWIYRPVTHKTAHRGKTREVLLGPKAIAVLAQFLSGLRFDAHLFDPKQAHAEQKAVGATQRRREGQQPNDRKTDRVMGDHYTTGSYRRAVQRACDKAEVNRWSPNQLRHNAATTMRKEHGLEAAALLLGHSEATVTAKHYAERDRGALEAIVARIG